MIAKLELPILNLKKYQNTHKKSMEVYLLYHICYLGYVVREGVSKLSSFFFKAYLVVDCPLALGHENI